VASVPGNPFAQVGLESYTLIQPLNPLPITNPLDFEPKVMREVIALGKARAKEILSGGPTATIRSPQQAATTLEPAPA
jgi:hypothetical protein